MTTHWLRSLRSTGALSLLVCLTSLGCRSSDEKARQSREAQERFLAAKTNQEMVKLANSLGAVSDWQEPLKSTAFTIAAEPIFIRGDHRPTFFYATLEDIRQNNSGKQLIFETTPTKDEPRLRLQISCGNCDIQYLSKFGAGLGDFALIAQITGLSKLLDGSDESPDYLLTGDYVAARYVGDLIFDEVLARRTTK